MEFLKKHTSKLFLLFVICLSILSIGAVPNMQIDWSFGIFLLAFISIIFAFFSYIVGPIKEGQKEIKDDFNSRIKKLETDTKASFEKLETDTKASFEKLETDTKASFEKLETDTKASFGKLETDTKASFGKLETDLRDIRNILYSHFSKKD